jgi:hypothetical protein
MIRRGFTPPTSPGIIDPGAAYGAEHVASQDPGTYVLKGLKSNVVVDAAIPTGLAVHLLEDLCVCEPRVQVKASNSERVVDVLPGPGAEPIE